MGLVLAVVAIGCFLLGFVPMWMSARSARAEAVEAKQDLALARLQILLGSAVVDARRGEYESARQTTSRFYTELKRELESENSAFHPPNQAQASNLLTNRDQVITLLARADAAGADQLSDLYLRYRNLGQEEAGTNMGGSGE